MNNTNQENKPSNKSSKKQKSLWLQAGIIVALIILAFVLGSMLNKSKDDKESIASMVDKENGQVIANVSSQSPEEVLEAYLAAIKAGNYKVAATYISENAKQIEKKLAKNAEEKLFDDFSKTPIVDFVIVSIDDLEQSESKKAEIKYTYRDSWGNNKVEDEHYYIDPEDGSWKINPTDYVHGKTFNDVINENEKLKVTVEGISYFVDHENVYGGDRYEANISIIAKSRIFVSMDSSVANDPNNSPIFILTTTEGVYESARLFIPYVPSHNLELNDNISGNFKIYFQNAKGSPLSLSLNYFYHVNNEFSPLVDDLVILSLE